MKVRLLTLCAAALTLGGGASAAVVRLQNGVAPTTDYVGCVDTRISIYNDAEARGRRGGEGKTANLRTYSTARRILLRFDLAAVPKGRTVRKALLRVYCAAPTGLGTVLFASPLTRGWDETATGFEHTKTDDDKGPEGNWATKGGDYDKALTLRVGVRGGSFGHAFEFDVTAVVADWLAGKRPNHGLILWSGQYTQHEIASSEWPVARFRPLLLIDHAPAAAAGAPADVQALPAPPKEVAMSAVASTADPGTASGEYATVRLGRGAGCRIREGVRDGYEKHWPAMAGRWDWMPMLRVGGAAGDFNVASLSFDLKRLAGASLRSAKLRLCVVDASRGWGIRYGLYGGPARAGDPSAAPLAVASFARPGRDNAGKPSWIEWDVTGAVRAAAGRAAAFVIHHDVEGGAFDAYSSKYDNPALRPHLEAEVSPPPKLPALEPIKPLSVPAGDYWVEPMRKVHGKFKGKPGSLAQYGDSITVTQAFIEPHYWGKTIVPDKCDPADVAKLKRIDAYAIKKLWRNKGPQFGCNGNMTVAWLHANVDRWQKQQQPEVAVILFGTNDVSYGPVPPDYTEKLAASIDRMLADGTIPILTTLPPRGDQKTRPNVLRRVREIRRAQLAIARTKRIPLIDFYHEMVSRQPQDWDKTLMGDSLHPSYRNPWKKDFTAEGLKNSGYTLRNYLTFMKWAEVIEKVLQPAAERE
jgi:hypothetical protein